VAAQQSGQLRDVRLLDPAVRVRAASLGAGMLAAALPWPPGRVDGDLPTGLGQLRDRGALPGAQIPASE